MYNTDPGKIMYANMQRFIRMEDAEEKPVKKTGLLGMPMANPKRENDELQGLPAKRVMTYMKMINDKRQELKNGNAGNTDV